MQGCDGECRWTRLRLISCAEVRQRPELLAQYAEETRIPGMALPEPQWDVYERLEASGVYEVLGLFAGDSLVGFAGLLTAPNPHHGVKIATVESLFVDKAHRGGTALSWLMNAVSVRARTAGCEEVLYSARAGSALEATLAKRYARTNSVFCISLR